MGAGIKPDATEQLGFVALWKEDLSVYREGLLAQGFWALRVHRYGAMTRRIRQRPLRLLARLPYHVGNKLTEILFGISIGSNAIIGRRCVIEHFGTIIIHSDTRIGDGVRLRQGVTIGIRNMDRPADAPTIGDRVDIGAGAKLLGAISIGDDVAIGANAVVLTDVPAHSIAVGVPAVIKPRRQVAKAA
ncbi:MAG: serine acetyltransferase [Hyphomicrobiales bacterium]|nr:MAG: serine acetyltransferase [Hyphomicrobiales bacterium]